MNPHEEFVEDKDTYYIYENKPITDEMIEEMKKYKKVYFGDSFNQSICDCLPNTITHINIGYSFNQSLDNLPSTIQCIYFGANNIFNMPLDNLPEGLVDLDLNMCRNFNQPINKLPSSLEILKLGSEFQQSVDNLPPNLKKLFFGWYF